MKKKIKELKMSVASAAQALADLQAAANAAVAKIKELEAAQPPAGVAPADVEAVVSSLNAAVAPPAA